MNELKTKAKRLGFHGLAANWEEYANQAWLPKLLEDEEVQRGQRSLERRIREAKTGEFKPMAQFDWSWPKRVDRELIEELFNFKFLEEKANVVFIGKNGLGKTMIAQNLAHQALLSGHTARFIKASALLDELSSADGANARRRCLKKYSQTALLVIDEVGYLEYGNRYGDLLYEVISERYQNRSTIITANRSFQEWGAVFPTAACVVTLVDRLVHKAEIVVIEGESFRHREAQERTKEREKARQNKKPKKE